jgi:hypothetical protein
MTEQIRPAPLPFEVGSGAGADRGARLSKRCGNTLTVDDLWFSVKPSTISGFSGTQWSR